MWVHKLTCLTSLNREPSLYFQKEGIPTEKCYCGGNGCNNSTHLKVGFTWLIALSIWTLMSKHWNIERYHITNMKLFILAFFITSSYSDRWCYHCNDCNPNDNHAYKYCQVHEGYRGICELSFYDGDRTHSKQGCSHMIGKGGCYKSYEGGREKTTCYCEHYGCNNADVFKVQNLSLIVTLTFLRLAWIKKVLDFKMSLAG